MKVTKVLLIRSSHYADNGKVVKSNTFLDRLFNSNFAELGLPLLAASTPPHINVEMVDDCLDETPEKSNAEVIGISAMVIHYSRAVDLAKHFRQQGKIVVMGGFLPTLNPELVLEHADSLCIGEGDKVWLQMLTDIENDCLQKTYSSGTENPMEGIPIPRYDLIKKNRVTLYPVLASRGCIHSCNYCSVICFYQNTFRTRPVADVVRDIKAHKSRFMYFVDDNLMDSSDYAKELFRAMQGLNVYWGLQASPSIANDPELLRLAFVAGCRSVAIGFDSISQDNLNISSKGWAKTQDYTMTIKKIQDAGIAVHALIMFGFPHDTSDVFQTTVDFLIDAGVSGVDFFILTPYPATPLGKEYSREGLIIDFDINHYREPYVVFKHPVMTGEEIQKGFWMALKRFYSIKNIYKRLRYSNVPNKHFAIYTNLYYRRKVRNKIVPTHNQRGDFRIGF